MRDNETTIKALLRFLEIIATLRDPVAGCPWDLKQTFETLKPLVIEEAYEVEDAVAAGPDAIREELGDLMSLIGLFAQIASERSLFSLADVLEGISNKLVRRHPHVFSDVSVSGTEDVLKNWERIKQEERKGSADQAPEGLLDGIPLSLPALLKAHQIGARCSRVGFDWNTRDDVVNKINEELGEFLKEAKPGSSDISASHPGGSDQVDPAFEEFGDLLFTIAQYSRKFGFNAEQALGYANNKFIKRFKQLEGIARERFPGRNLSDLGRARLEELWGEVKSGER
jgi:ATP diphosphatase